MKQFLIALLFLVGFAFPASAAGCAGTGNCYFVGGTGNTSDTTRWATTDGGATTGSVPTSADNCNFTALSNATAYTVTVDVALSCKDITTALPASSGVPTITASAFGISIFGNTNFVAGTLVTGGTGLAFSATTTGKTITTNGVQFAGAMTFNGSGGGWTLQDDLTIASTRTLSISAGILNTNAKTVSTGFYSSTSGTRTLTGTNSTFNITGVSSTPWNVTTVGSYTQTLTGSTINFNGGTAGGSLSLTVAALSYGTVNITGPGLWTMSGGATFAALTYTSTTNKTDTFITSSTINISASGILTIAGNSTVNRAFFRSNTLGTQRSINVNASATVTLTNADFQDIGMNGGPFTGTSLGDCLGNSGITFDGSTTQTWTSQASTDNWSTPARWTSRVPLPQDDVVLAGQAAAGGIAVDMPRIGRNIDFTGFQRTVTFSSTLNSMFGNITLSATAGYSATQSLTLQGRGAQTIASNGKTFPQAVAIQAFGGTYTQQDNFVTGGSFTFSAGTWAAQGFNFTATSLSGSAATAGSVFSGTGIVTITSGSGTILNLTSANLSLALANATLVLNGNNSTTTTLGTGSSTRTFGTIIWSSTASTGTMILSGSGGFIVGNFQIDGTTARTVQFASGVTQIIGTLTQTNVGTAGNVVTFNSSTPGTQYTLQSSGRKQSVDYLNITDSNAIGGAGWHAGQHSVSGGNNYGWQFRPPANINTLLRGKRAANDNVPLRLAA